MNASINVMAMEAPRPVALVARNRRCGAEARRRRASLFVTGLLVLSAVLMLVDRRANERTASPPPAALIGSI